MGLDLALGGLVLISAIRGWLKGFLVQAIRLVALVVAVYIAAPVRDEAKPYVVEYLPTIGPELVDRLLWWTSAVVSYFVIAGVASLAVAISRRQTFGIAEPRRADQHAGFGLGMIKGLIVASFLVSSIQKYAQPQIAKVAWAQDQIKNSVAWDWNERYHPADRIWRAPPVQQFVNHIQKMGLIAPSGKPAAEPQPEPEKAMQTASRTPSLTLSNRPTPYQVPPPPRRKKLVLRKPFEVSHLWSEPPRSATIPNDPPAADLAKATGLDPDSLQTMVESMESEPSGSSGLQGLLPGIVENMMK